MASKKSSVVLVSDNHRQQSEGEGSLIPMEGGGKGNDANNAIRVNTVMVGDQEHVVVEVVRTKGTDVPEGDYPVILVKGMRKPVVDGVIRHFSAHGLTIRAAHNKEVGEKGAKGGHELPANAVVVSDKVLAILRAVAAVTGEEVAMVLENAVEQIAASNDVPPALVARILARLSKTTEAQS